MLANIGIILQGRKQTMILRKHALLSTFFISHFSFASNQCDLEKYHEVIEPASSINKSVHLLCDLELDGSEVITKKIIIEGSSASNISINCNNAQLNGGNGTINSGQDMIEVRSKRYLKDSELVQNYPNYDSQYAWSVPSGIKIENCRIKGSVRLWGMGKNGEEEDVRYSSTFSDHPLRIRNNAPSYVKLDNVTIDGTGRIPLYIAPGVNNVHVSNSNIKGKSVSVGVYFDTESSHNIIENSTIQTKTDSRELIAIDGSSHNKLFNNYLSSLNNGGIYFYRNCGEGGTVRHTPPEHNQIINNIFYYKSYWGWEDAIYLGSRNGLRTYCNDDSGYSFGSSISNYDYARYNVIAQNQVFKFDPDDMIDEGRNTDSPNYYFENKKVSSAKKQDTGCYHESAFPDKFINHGKTFSQFTDSSGNTMSFTPYYQSCDQGHLKATPSPKMIAVLFSITTILL